ncbi:hypothetical protein KC332_g16653 [Hortaea werneckii]|nr:hypothetical protein KC358_g17274 [Hortaea werneckii]KAI6799004.1 hypothetical protein KC350_g16192 [Hortaea werneckii]KAI6901562.1 hypothetical protein KC348_g16432 [Hortaea werneckii]KAI6917218.1 hypothetical protein KC341_g18667 [Hortaea werneckii]KAI6961857.1 hypothetical protein KC329_g16556 [Hortaea werneckii]
MLQAGQKCLTKGRSLKDPSRASLCSNALKAIEAIYSFVSAAYRNRLLYREVVERASDIKQEGTDTDEILRLTNASGPKPTGSATNWELTGNVVIFDSNASPQDQRMDSSPQLRHIVQAMAEQDPTKLPTPSSCTADFCLVPIGTPTASVSKEVAEVQRLLKKSGVKYSMHSAGTTIEGTWEECMRIIGQCHTMLHSNGVVRIQSDIRVGSRTDKKQSFDDKVSAVNKLLAEDKQ